MIYSVKKEIEKRCDMSKTAGSENTMGRKREMLSREKVEAVLFKMGMPANVKGFRYVGDCVLILEEDRAG